MRPRSREVLRANPTRTDLRLEHIVPRKVVDAKLQAIDLTNIDALRLFLVENLLISFITIEEDDRLTAAGLRSKMPDGSNAPLARYAAVEPQVEGVLLRDQSTGAPAEAMADLKGQIISE